jgi:hypothetical protein
MDFEIKKNDTTLDTCKQSNGVVTIEMSFQDTKDLVTTQITLTKEEVLKFVEALTKDY